ncbi:aldehyde dehydrogenase family protein [Anaerosphaera multitolerans]|uniref:aldehyde dehydrogenase family protein n=1 Tax=Anaerosphaera multitolerans TaxID=2487351 RepID=UPI0013E2C20E|nr:aldehyde dehydrogenase family protein [Anaerosphaera multitolerans]
MKDYNLYINGKWIPSQGNDFIEVENPATREILAKVPAATENDVLLAIKGSKSSFPMWSKTDPLERLNYVRKIYDYLVKHKDEISKTLSLELGCPLSFGKNRHVEPYLANIENYFEIAENYSYAEDNKDFKIYREPVGVIACITPWNYPFGQIVKKVIPGLLTGNTILLKPSKRTPLTAYYFAEAAEYAKLPPGVFQLLPGRGGEVGNILARDSDVDMVTFTGSTSGGKEIGKLALDTVKKITLELGGKSAAVVLEGADLKMSLKKVLDTVYLNVGQTCSAKSRLVAPRSLKPEIEKHLIELTKSYKFGNPEDESTDVGPLQSKAQFEKVSRYIEIGKEEARLLYEGEIPKGEGYYIGPVIFTDVAPKSKIAQEEIFGPVLSVIYYDTLEEAIEIGNDSIYGLSGMVFGPEKEALEVARQIRTGQIQINDGVFSQNAPFGGYKQSGLGREGSKYGFEEFLEIKAIFM